MKARLIYDGTCPVCTNYVRLLRKKVHPERIDFIPTTKPTSEFQYTSVDGSDHFGLPAIDKLAFDFPEVLDYMWMLPQKYRVDGLKAAYKLGSAVRSVIKKGCGCKKSK